MQLPENPTLLNPGLSRRLLSVTGVERAGQPQ
jgi:hypothetical protein